MSYRYSNDLGKRLNCTILMPRVASFDWAALADEQAFEFIALTASKDAEKSVPV